MACALAWSWPCGLLAELTRFEITSREPYADGRGFGEVGPYEKIEGRAWFAVDPVHPANAEIVDLEFAPRNEQGGVTFSSDWFILAPRHPAKGNGAIVYDVNNRGNKLALKFFNDASGENDARDAGNEFLFRRGYTIVWSGWNGELLPGDGRLQLAAPAPNDSGRPITGLVRYEICPDKAETRRSIVRANHGAYQPTDTGITHATLTWRLYPRSPRIPIPRDQFRLHVTEVASGRPGQLPLIELDLPSGFRQGYLYELIYEAQQPLVHGVCFAAVRDLIAALRNGEGENNPLAGRDRGKIERAYGFGVSQSGRFLREFVYSGFNADERQRLVFDGLIPHVAGAGLGSFNHRFAQPTVFATQHEHHDWATDRFPFAYETQEDPLTKQCDGILLKATVQKCAPKILHTQSSTEYWSRAGSLVHTDPLGKRDAAIPDNVRVYALGGTQHGPTSFPPEKGIGQAPANPGDYRPFLRALLDRLDGWCREGKQPPPSVFPTLRDRTLVDCARHATGFPLIPGVRYPEVIGTASLLDLGDRWQSNRIIDRHPPVRRSDYTVRVPCCDADGNELGCLLPPEVAVPLATFTGWALRSREAGAENDLVGLNGSYLAFPTTKSDRESTGDPRRSMEERYGTLDRYLDPLERECRRLADEGYLLKEDISRIVQRQRERAAPIFAKISGP